MIEFEGLEVRDFETPEETNKRRRRTNQGFPSIVDLDNPSAPIKSWNRDRMLAIRDYIMYIEEYEGGNFDQKVSTAAWEAVRALEAYGEAKEKMNKKYERLYKAIADQLENRTTHNSAVGLERARDLNKKFLK